MRETIEQIKANEIADTHWHQGYRAHDANASRETSEHIPGDDVRRQWLDFQDEQQNEHRSMIRRHTP